MILATRFAFIVARTRKNTYFHQKMAWPPATYDVISCNHSNWQSLKLVLKCVGGMNEQLLKTSGANVLSPRKNSEEPYGGGGTPTPPHCTSEGYYNLRYISECAIPTLIIIIKYNLPQCLFHAIRYPSDVILYFRHLLRCFDAVLFTLKWTEKTG